MKGGGHDLNVFLKYIPAYCLMINDQMFVLSGQQSKTRRDFISNHVKHRRRENTHIRETAHFLG